MEATTILNTLSSLSLVFLVYYLWMYNQCFKNNLRMKEQSEMAKKSKSADPVETGYYLEQSNRSIERGLVTTSRGTLPSSILDTESSTVSTSSKLVEAIKARVESQIDFDNLTQDEMQNISHRSVSFLEKFSPTDDLLTVDPAVWNDLLRFVAPLSPEESQKLELKLYSCVWEKSTDAEQKNTWTLNTRTQINVLEIDSLYMLGTLGLKIENANTFYRVPDNIRNHATTLCNQYKYLTNSSIDRDRLKKVYKALEGEAIGYGG